MGTYVHSIKTKNGNYLYRTFSDTSNMYNTPSLNEEEMTLYLLYDRAINRGVFNVEMFQIPERIQRTRENGTSEIGDTRRQDKWDNFPRDYGVNGYFKGKTKKEFMQDTINNLNLSVKDMIVEYLQFWKENIKGDIPGPTIDYGKDRENKINTLINILNK